MNKYFFSYVISFLLVTSVAIIRYFDYENFINSLLIIFSILISFVLSKSLVFLTEVAYKSNLLFDILFSCLYLIGILTFNIKYLAIPLVIVSATYMLFFLEQKNYRNVFFTIGLLLFVSSPFYPPLLFCVFLYFLLLFFIPSNILKLLPFFIGIIVGGTILIQISYLLELKININFWEYFKSIFSIDKKVLYAKTPLISFVLILFFFSKYVSSKQIKNSENIEYLNKYNFILLFTLFWSIFIITTITNGDYSPIMLAILPISLIFSTTINGFIAAKKSNTQ